MRPHDALARFQTLDDLDAVAAAEPEGDRPPPGGSVLIGEHPGLVGLPDQKRRWYGHRIRLVACLDEDLRPLPDRPVRGQSGQADIDQELARLAVCLPPQPREFARIRIRGIGPEDDGGGLSGGQVGAAGFVDPGRDPDFVGGDDFEDGRTGV